LLFALAAPVHAGEPDLGTEAQRAAGEALYERMCAQCHGEEGDGAGEGHDFFDPPPRDFTGGAYKIRTTDNGELPTTQDLVSIIRRGMPFTGMPPWPDLTDEELSSLAYFLKTFAEDFADPDANVPPKSFPPPPPFSAESAEAGRSVYEDNKCIDCHGVQGRGDGESGPTLTDDWDHPIRPADLTRRWTFRGGGARADLYRTLTTGLNGTPMPSYADSIDEAKRWQLVDYVYSLSPSASPGRTFTLVVEPVTGAIDLSRGKAAFEDAAPGTFPVIGQVVEIGRAFQPSATEVEVRAIANADEVAVLLVWHDMTADTSGNNDPRATVVEGAEPPKEAVFSDAVAFQIPAHAPSGAIKPYFLFGDARRPVELWYADLAREAAVLMQGKGGARLSVIPGELDRFAAYDQGEWSVAFKRRRAGTMPFEDDAFIPFAVSIWDGLRRERGSKRGVTSWFHLYVKPAEAPDPAGPAVAAAGLVVLLEALFVLFFRRRAARAQAASRERKHP